jgi:type VI protein secretion system component Hcp
MRSGLIALLAVALASTAAAAAGKGGGAGGHEPGQHPQASLSLNYGKIEHTYKQQQPSGTARSKRVSDKNATSASSTKTSNASKKGAINFGDIKGESQDDKHKDWIEIR